MRPSTRLTTSQKTMADKPKQWHSKKSAGLNFEETLAEQVRHYPVVYNRTLPAFKDKQLRESAWEEISKAVGLNSGKRAETCFKRLRDRYTRLKKAVEESKRNGDIGDNGKIRASIELEPLQFMDWIYPHIYHRYSRQGQSKHPVTMAHKDEPIVSVVEPEYMSDTLKEEEEHTVNETTLSTEKLTNDATVYESDTGSNHARPIMVTHCPQVDAVLTCCSQTLPPQKRNASVLSRDTSRLLDDSDDEHGQSDSEYCDNPKKPCDALQSHTTHSQHEDDLFCSFVGSQLRLMNQQQKLMAKYQINNILFQILMHEGPTHARAAVHAPTRSVVCTQINCTQGDIHNGS